jgi:hypothetical protein
VPNSWLPDTGKQLESQENPPCLPKLGEQVGKQMTPQGKIRLEDLQFK